VQAHGAGGTLSAVACKGSHLKRRELGRISPSNPRSASIEQALLNRGDSSKPSSRRALMAKSMRWPIGVGRFFAHTRIWPPNRRGIARHPPFHRFGLYRQCIATWMDSVCVQTDEGDTLAHRPALFVCGSDAAHRRIDPR
jgi:hypothetical protein